MSLKYQRSLGIVLVKWKSLKRNLNNNLKAENEHSRSENSRQERRHLHDPLPEPKRQLLTELPQKPSSDIPRPSFSFRLRGVLPHFPDKKNWSETSLWLKAEVRELRGSSSVLAQEFTPSFLQG